MHEEGGGKETSKRERYKRAHARGSFVLSLSRSGFSRNKVIEEAGAGLARVRERERERRERELARGRTYIHIQVYEREGRKERERERLEAKPV